MSELISRPTVENKVNDLNKKIVEIKKKIQLSDSLENYNKSLTLAKSLLNQLVTFAENRDVNLEGQRKANFEEHDARKQENIDKIASLKQQIKNLYVEYGKAKNYIDTTEYTVHVRETSASGKTRTSEEMITKVEEDNVRLRKKLDLIKYQREKLEYKSNLLLQEYKQLMSGKTQKKFKKKLENPLKNKMINLEVRLEHISMMQIKANIMRMKYRSMKTDLKEKSVFYASSLKDLENDIKEQENEMKRLQGVKKEAVELRDNTQETLMKEEVDITNSSKERNAMLQDYRQRVLERKMELERLERIIFHSRARDDFDTRGKSRVQATEDNTKDEVTRLEAAFAKLRNATGVSRSEDVLNRFLGQRATKDNLQKMRATIEEEKMVLEKKRQELIAEMETRKFSETKNAEQNAEETKSFKEKIADQRTRQEKAEAEHQRVRGLLPEINVTLWHIWDKLRDLIGTLPVEPREINDPLELVEMINEKVKNVIDNIDNAEKYFESLGESLTEKFETISITTTSAEGKTIRTSDGPLFPRFPLSATPAAGPSDDEEDVPTRNTLKKQAQQLVDAKTRRKGFTFRR